MPADAPTHQDGRNLDPERLADVRAIEDLAIAYAYAVDDKDWVRWEALFQPDGLVDYTRSLGIKGTPADCNAWVLFLSARRRFSGACVESSISTAATTRTSPIKRANVAVCMRPILS